METPGNFKQIYFKIIFWLQPFHEIQIRTAPFLQFLKKLGSRNGHSELYSGDPS